MAKHAFGRLFLFTIASIKKIYRKPLQIARSYVIIHEKEKGYTHTTVRWMGEFAG